ncbi:META domain-containing protein [Spirosoma flavum]|uniref:META domain-containing protein n=1 Tax=Spirosoma flavum TaxID=2048557 RepID=A0ABW6AEL7_9BACT
MRDRTIVSLLLLLLLSQCSQKETVVAPQIAHLIGTWRLVEPDSSYAVTLHFAYDKDNPPHDITPFLASGKSSVNSYTLRLFATLDGMMSADNLASTKVGGTPEATTFEKTYFANLEAAVRYELTADNRLRLFHGGAPPHIMVYKRMN